MSTPEPEQRRYNVGALKIPFADRDIAHTVLTSEDLRDYFDIMGSDTPDEDERWTFGTKVAYTLMLTDDEADLFRTASNVRYVELDLETTEAAGNLEAPSGTSRKYMGVEFPGTDSWHGRDVNIAILDGGVTTAMRTYMGWTQVARSVFGGYTPGSDEITTSHGCLVAPCAVPRNGRILDAIIADDAGSGSHAAFSAAVVWAVDNGADVINYSYSGTAGSAALIDGVEYAQDAGVPIVAAAGNDGLNLIRYPGAYCTTYNNVFSAGNFDEDTNARASSSNYSVDVSGVAPGTDVLGFNPNATFTFWSGTSAASPHMAGLIARASTGGQYTPMQAAAALKTYARNTGQTSTQQGAGAWDLEAALTGLGATLVPATISRTNLCPNPSLETVTTGYTVVSARSGITVGSVGRGTTIAGHAGPTYGFVNITGDGTTSSSPDAVIGFPDCTVTAGTAYTFSAHIRFGTSTLVWGPIELRIDWRNSSNTSLGTTTSAQESLMVVAWHRYFVTGTAPTGAVKAVITARVYGCTNTAAQSFRFDALLYEAGADPLFYFDGDTTGGGAWTGTADASTSTLSVTGPASGSLKVGSTTIAALRVGSAAALRAYLGTNLVWGTAP